MDLSASYFHMKETMFLLRNLQGKVSDPTIKNKLQISQDNSIGFVEQCNLACQITEDAHSSCQDKKCVFTDADITPIYTKFMNKAKENGAFKSGIFSSYCAPQNVAISGVSRYINACSGFDGGKLPSLEDLQK